MNKTVETIEIQGGTKYAKVAARLAAAHEANESLDIITSCEYKDGFALFSARVVSGKGSFCGHSMGKTGKQKEFEKLETIAVGRALAFAGFLASGDIATFEEMAEVVSADKLNSLKLKFAKLRKDELEGLDRDKKQQRFNSWARSVIGEDVNYNDLGSWEQPWFKQCWQDLVGVDPEVPFDE